MSLLRPSIGGRMLKASVPAFRRAVPATLRFDSSTAVGTPLTISQVESKKETSVTEQRKTRSHNAPDYGAEVDQAAS
jgi:NADH dehydrogenase (ubiquinone) Fe-S protein 4